MADRYVSQEMRNFIFTMKGRSCTYCGRWASVVDHDVPLSRTGTSLFEFMKTNSAHNLVPSCQECNSRKGTKTGAEFRAILAQESAMASFAAMLTAPTSPTPPYSPYPPQLPPWNQR